MKSWKKYFLSSYNFNPDFIEILCDDIKLIQNLAFLKFLTFSCVNGSQNKSQQPSDDTDIKQELKKTKSKIQQYDKTVKTMEEELNQNKKELESTKAEVSLLNKKLEGKQMDLSVEKQSKDASINDNKNIEEEEKIVTSSSDPLKNKNILLEQKVN